MAKRLGLFQMWLGGDYAERATINANAEALDGVEQVIREQQMQIDKQAKEIMELRATVMALAEVLQRKVPYDDGELEQEVKVAYAELMPPPPAEAPHTDRRAGDPYRGLPAPLEDSAEAKQLLAEAQEYHFMKQFSAARKIYQDIVDRFGETKQAVAARQQIANLAKV